ncbi:MAG: LLM class F420-dependent oxidoreductase, partial [Anaerolineae bacterium]|nr:LLM class F420-dependent oxidoreductase [Anaerolineae bacterium]
QQGRKLENVKRSVPTNTTFGKDEADLRAKLEAKGVGSTDELWERGATGGTASELVDRLSQWEAAGVERLLLQWIDLDDLESLELIARDVLPHFHKN